MMRVNDVEQNENPLSATIMHARAWFGLLLCASLNVLFADSLHSKVSKVVAPTEGCNNVCANDIDPSDHSLSDTRSFGENDPEVIDVESLQKLITAGKVNLINPLDSEYTSNCIIPGTGSNSGAEVTVVYCAHRK